MAPHFRLRVLSPAVDLGLQAVEAAVDAGKLEPQFFAERIGELLTEVKACLPTLAR